MERVDIKIVEESKKPLAMNPKVFGLWIFLGSVVMLFAALTSACIVRRADGNWLNFELPSVFWLTSVIILLSSVTMQWAYVSAKKNERTTSRLMLILTLVLGLIFLVGQVYGWAGLVIAKAYWVGNPAGSFVYVLTGLHAVHLVSALVVLILAIPAVTRRNPMLRLQLCATYWHFLGILWLYLFVFLLLTR